jgi:hypothetical protein
VYFVGFAGVAEEHVFAEEIKLAAHIVDERFGTSGHQLLLINDRRDIDTYPIATASGLAYALKAIAEKMNPDRDILFLAISSHGAADASVSVSNGGLQLEQLSDEDLAAALHDSGIKRRIIVISACYAGSVHPVARGSRHGGDRRRGARQDFVRLLGRSRPDLLRRGFLSRRAAAREDVARVRSSRPRRRSPCASARNTRRRRSRRPTSEPRSAPCWSAIRCASSCAASGCARSFERGEVGRRCSFQAQFCLAKQRRLRLTDLLPYCFVAMTELLLCTTK